MMPSRLRPLAALGALAVLVALGSAKTAAQQAAPAQTGAAATSRPPAPPPSYVESQDAERTREQLMEVLGRYSPAVGRVLKLDPTLLSNPSYLAPYPQLISFLSQHPEVVRSPAYYFERISATSSSYYYPERATSPGLRATEQVSESLTIMVVVGTIVAGLTWLIRTFLDYRRWLRLSKSQNEAHSKLLDRFSANDELIAYVQSPAGSKFLQSAPIALDAHTRSLAAPFGRILWAVQAGVVLSAAGLGLQFIGGRIDPDVKDTFFILGVLALSLGVGFIISAVAAFVLSRRLGVLDVPGTPSAAVRPDATGSHL